MRHKKKRLFVKVLHKRPMSFVWSVLATNITNQHDLDSCEESFIKEMNTLHPNGYNLVTGGRGGRKSAETRANMSRTQSRIDVREKRNAAIKAAHNRPEVRARNSAAQKEAQNRPEVKVKRNEAIRLACARQEVKERRAAAQRARWKKIKEARLPK